MGAKAYIDSSALLKLVVEEAETAALETDLAGRESLLASRLAVLECRRAVRRVRHRRMLQAVDALFEAVYLLDITTPILEAAAAMEPPMLRSLDAIHIATAVSIGDPDLEVITYDDRCAAAARANGLVVVAPGKVRTQNAEVRSKNEEVRTKNEERRR
jgi:uncharacterized protein